MVCLTAAESVCIRLHEFTSVHSEIKMIDFFVFSESSCHCRYRSASSACYDRWDCHLAMEGFWMKGDRGRESGWKTDKKDLEKDEQHCVTPSTATDKHTHTHTHKHTHMCACTCVFWQESKAWMISKKESGRNQGQKEDDSLMERGRMETGWDK